MGWWRRSPGPAPSSGTGWRCSFCVTGLWVREHLSPITILGGHPVNMHPSPAGGSRARYVDVLNPGGPQRSEPTLAPADFFAPLAPLPIPPNLFVPNPGRQQWMQQASLPGLHPSALTLFPLTLPRSRYGLRGSLTPRSSPVPGYGTGHPSVRCATAPALFSDRRRGAAASRRGWQWGPSASWGTGRSGAHRGPQGRWTQWENLQVSPFLCMRGPGCTHTWAVLSVFKASDCDS